MNKEHILFMLAIVLSLANIFLLHLNTSITGNVLVSSRVVVLGDCYFTLRPGWNQVSLCGNETNYSVKELMKQIEGEYRYVLKWDEPSQKFLVYSPRAANPEFEYLDYNESFFILFTGSEKEYLGSDVEFGDLNISTTKGWNALPFPYQFNSTIQKVLSYTPSYRYALKWDNVTQRFLIYSPRSAVPEFTVIRMGEGFFLLTYDKSFVYYNVSYLES